MVHPVFPSRSRSHSSWTPRLLRVRMRKWWRRPRAEMVGNQTPRSGRSGVRRSWRVGGGIATEGHLHTSGDVFKDLKGSLGIDLKSLGPLELKLELQLELKLELELQLELQLELKLQLQLQLELQLELQPPSPHPAL